MKQQTVQLWYYCGYGGHYVSEHDVALKQARLYCPDCGYQLRLKAIRFDRR